MSTLYDILGANTPTYGTPERTALAVAAGVGQNYTGTAKQNEAIVQYLQKQQQPTATKAKTQAELDAEYASALAAHPTFASNSADALAYASSTGDFSGLVDSTGKPFSAADQTAAMAQGTADLAPYYAAEKQYEIQNVEDALRQKQLDYQNYLDTTAVNFQTEKTKQDQAAADQGVLFSGGRAQKQQALQTAYDTAGAYKRASMGTDIAGISRDYQYKYGNEAANPLSSYYNLGGNTYNPNVATGGVGSSGLSAIYNPSASNFQGTQVNVAKAEAQKRAAGYLWNKGNKLVPLGYKNQY